MQLTKISISIQSSCELSNSLSADTQDLNWTYEFSLFYDEELGETIKDPDSKEILSFLGYSEFCIVSIYDDCILNAISFYSFFLLFLFELMSSFQSVRGI